MGIETLKSNNIFILSLYDSGSSHNLLDRSCRDMCQSIIRTKVVLSAIDASKAIWMDVGILYIDAVASDGEKKVLKLEVYVTDLNSDRYAQVKIKTPSVWTRAYKLPCHWVSSGGCPKLIIGNSFLNKFPHVRVANYDGLTLNKSSISGNYFVQGESITACHSNTRELVQETVSYD